MASVTGQEIREELAKWGLCRLLGTASAGAVNYITDSTRLLSAALSSTEFEDCYVRITSGAADGEQSKVDYLDQDLGRLYISPSGTAIASGMTYEVWRAGVNPDDVDRCRDEALTRICSTWALQPISEIINADWEDALAAGNWVSGTNSSDVITALSFPSEVWRNSDVVTNTGAQSDTYSIHSASLYTRPGRHFYIYAPVSARVSTVDIYVRDVTNSASISLSGPATQVTGRGWTAFEVTGEVPAGCYEIQVWFNGTATSVFEVGPINFHWEGQKRFDLPGRIVSKKYVGNIYRLDQYMVASQNDYWGREHKNVVSGVKKVSVQDAVVLEFDDAYPLVNAPHFYEERIYYDALSAGYMTAAQRVVGDTATTLCPLDYVTAATALLLGQQYYNKQPWDKDFWSSIVAQAEQALAELETTFGPEPKPQLERERTILVPVLRV